MSDSVDWSVTSWEGNRRLQHQEFLALPFRDKVRAIEQLGEIAEWFADRRRARGLPVSGPGGRTGDQVPPLFPSPE